MRSWWKIALIALAVPLQALAMGSSPPKPYDSSGGIILAAVHPSLLPPPQHSPLSFEPSLLQSKIIRDQGWRYGPGEDLDARYSMSPGVSSIYYDEAPWTVPTEMRVKRNRHGKPLVKIRRTGFSKYRITVSLEIGLFGPRREELLMAIPQAKPLPLQSCRILPAAPGWDPETGARIDPNIPVYEKFEAVCLPPFADEWEYMLKFAPSRNTCRPFNLPFCEADTRKKIKWDSYEESASAIVTMELSKAGFKLFKTALKHGQLTLPMVAVGEFKSARRNRHTDISLSETYVSVDDESVQVPGGVACVTRSWFGRLKTDCGTDMAK